MPTYLIYTHVPNYGMACNGTYAHTPSKALIFEQAVNWLLHHIKIFSTSIH